MSDWAFWAVALGLSGAVALMLVRVYRNAPIGADAGAAEADLAVYKDQMAEVERDLARGTLGAEEAQRLRAEVGRRVLEADRAKGGRTAIRASRGGLIIGVIAAAVVPGALAFYWVLGAPGYPDMALVPRLEALDAAIAARPGQEQELARLLRPRDAALDAKLLEELAGISAPDLLRAAFRRHFEADEMQEALRTQERLISVLGANVQSVDQANLALVLVLEADGYVSPEAEAALRESLKLDMGNELARYLVGEMFLQGGRFDQAFRFWRPLVESGDPDAPWVGAIRERIEDVAGLAGIPYVLPDAAPGPTAEDVAAAEEMAPEDRQAMIEGMVAQLSARLASEGGPVEDWNRLIRSLVVLERKAEAQAIYDEAKVVFEGQSAELSFLRLAAVESGLQP